MKQFKHGKKVINWHRNEVSSHRKRQIRSERVRAKELAYARNEFRSVEDIISAENSYEIEIENIFYKCPCCPAWDGSEDKKALQNNIFRNALFFTRSIQTIDAGEKLNKLLSENKTVKQNPSPDIYDYYLFLNHPNRFYSNLGIRYMQSKIGNARKAIQKVENDRKLYGFTDKVCLFAPFWVRSPESWDPESSVDLIKHLFEKYPVPEFLRQCWYNNTDQKWLLWHIILTQGLSLKKYSDKFGWGLNKKFQVALTSIEGKITPKDAAFKAQVLSMNGNEKDLERLSIHDYLKYDPSNIVDNKFKRFWLSTISWFIRNRDLLSDQECRLILEWAMHKYTESERPNRPEFSWKKRTVISVIRASQDYNNSRKAAVSNKVWTKYGLERTYELEGEIWTFTELNSEYLLCIESQNMHHCVNTYSGKCISGDTAILSLKRNGCREVTVEITIPKFVVVQAKKSYNRAPNDLDRKVIELWKEDIHLPANLSK